VLWHSDWSGFGGPLFFMIPMPEEFQLNVKILVDDNIPFGLDAFSTIGRTTPFDGLSLIRSMLDDADILCVRSTTKVNEALLKDTPVKFVATASIGFDHVDTRYLRQNGIGFASAPGSNANSVGEYIVSALLAVGETMDINWRGKTMGVVGVGNVGRNVENKVKALGLIPVLNDPPLYQQTKDQKYRPLKELMSCDVISLHTPLTYGGPFPTFHLADDAFFRKLKNCLLFINTARGRVVASVALGEAIREGRIHASVLDVFESEPVVTPESVKGATIITPHIAGHSLDGKVNGTRMIYESVCCHLKIDSRWEVSDSLPKADVAEMVINNETLDHQHSLARAVFALYDIREDDIKFRALLDTDVSALGFQKFRKDYRIRREFYNTRIELGRTDSALESVLSRLGFDVKRKTCI